MAALLGALHLHLQKHYLQYIIRIYQEVPFFNVPRGQPADADPRGVGWFGISKGAGAGLLAAEDDPSVRCAVCDGMFSIIYTVVPYMRRWITIYNKSYFVQGLLPSWYYAALARVALRRV